MKWVADHHIEPQHREPEDPEWNGWITVYEMNEYLRLSKSSDGVEYA